MDRKQLKICRACALAHGALSFSKTLPRLLPSALPSCWGILRFFMVTQFDLEGVIAAGDGDAASVVAVTPTPTTNSAAVTVTVAEAITWRRRVMSGLVNTFVGRGNWRLALGLLEDLGREQCSSSSSSGNRTSSTAATGEKEAAAGDALRVELLSRIGRVFLQFGSLEDAEVYFRRAEKAAAAAATEGAKEDNPRVSPSSRLVAVVVVVAGVGLAQMAWNGHVFFVLALRKEKPRTLEGFCFCSFCWCGIQGSARAVGRDWWAALRSCMPRVSFRFSGGVGRMGAF